MNKAKAYAVCVLFLIIGIGVEIAFIPAEENSAAWWPFPYGLAAGMGFFGCWILIIVAKLIMAPLIQKDPDYYHEGGEKDD